MLYCFICVSLTEKHPFSAKDSILSNIDFISMLLIIWLYKYLFNAFINNVSFSISDCTFLRVLWISVRYLKWLFEPALSFYDIFLSFRLFSWIALSLLHARVAQHGQHPRRLTDRISPRTVIKSGKIFYKTLRFWSHARRGRVHTNASNKRDAIEAHKYTADLLRVIHFSTDSVNVC